MADTPNQELADLLAGDLTEAEADELRDRLNATEAGRAALEGAERLAAFLRDEPATEPPPSAVARAKREFARSRPGLVDRIADGVRSCIASLDFDSRFSPAVAGFRGVEEVAQVAFSAGPCELDIEIQPTEEGQAGLRGQIDADDPAGWNVAAVGQDGRTAAETDADADGAFRLRLDPGAYTLVLTRGDVRVEAGPFPLP